MSDSADERLKTVLELDCEICGKVWEAEAYADYAHHDLIPEFVEVHSAECPDCDAWVIPRRYTDIGNVLLARLDLMLRSQPPQLELEGLEEK